MRYRLLLLLVMLPLLAAPARAGILFGRKKEKPDPKRRVPELVSILKTDKDADKRAKAAEELRNYDPLVFPDIVPVLVEALQHDPKTGVRIEAAHSLAKLRPVSQAIGETLEQAVAHDPSMRVRLQARSALLQYHWAGYKGKKSDVPPLTAATHREPPLGGGEQVPPAINTTRPPPPPPGPSPLQELPAVPGSKGKPPAKKDTPLSPLPPVPKPRTGEGPQL